ncbi:hypothetical protein TNCV_649891 [Trichonephila clavipes]|nr:hypothetical protein TNCV_649891 [Trichonephila clavipes]
MVSPVSKLYRTYLRSWEGIYNTPHSKNHPRPEYSVVGRERPNEKHLREPHFTVASSIVSSEKDFADFSGGFENRSYGSKLAESNRNLDVSSKKCNL